MSGQILAFLELNDPVVLALVAGAIVVIVLTIVGRALGAARRRADSRRHAREQRDRRRAIDQLREATMRAAAGIVATSSTNSIAGYRVVRQIEAVFTDGHPNAERAVETLKALAAAKGANAVINLAGERTTVGKCAARGDAVIVQSLDTPAYDVTVHVTPPPDEAELDDGRLLPFDPGEHALDVRSAASDETERPLTFLRYAKERLTGKRKRRQ